jgi:NAD(P)-dependent dehydrogenase (short-subunit alcohol dehydrogenase family)
MSDKIFIITGGSHGIGAETARLLAQDGYDVYVMDTHLR